MILTSCGQEETNNQFNKEKQLENIKNDPVFIEYHNLMQDVAKLVAESETLDFDKYLKIMNSKSKGVNHCDVDKSIFDGDNEMEFIVETQCKIGTKGKIFHDKYPLFKKLSKKERLEFFSDPSLKFDYDLEAIKRKGEKDYRDQQKEN